jgi:hypothetical protein
MMAVLDKAEREVTIGGKTRVMRMDFNALIAAEEITGADYIPLAAWRDLRMRDYRAIAYGCLLQKDPSVTAVEVGSWMGPGVLDDDTAGMVKAIGDLYTANVETAVPVDDTETKDLPFATAGAPAGP